MKTVKIISVVLIAVGVLLLLASLVLLPIAIRLVVQGQGGSIGIIGGADVPMWWFLYCSYGLDAWGYTGVCLIISGLVMMVIGGRGKCKK
jgi:hypothetical protein